MQQQPAVIERDVARDGILVRWTRAATRLRITTMHFHIRLERKAFLPEYKGSMLRGVFGKALALFSCHCNDTVLPDCLYHAVFVPPPNDNIIPHLEHVEKVSPLYVIQPPRTRRREFGAGEELTFSIRLFGYATEYAPNLIQVVEAMGKIGLTVHSIPFKLLDVAADFETSTRPVYDGITRRYAAFPQPLVWHQGGLITDASAAEITFLTPGSFQREGEITSNIDVLLLTRSLLRRLGTLLYFGEGYAEARELLQAGVPRIDDLRLVNVNVETNHIPRYSNNQQSEMKFSGVVGTLRLEGDIAPWIPLFEFGQYVHVGKRTTFGFGQYTFDLIS